MNLVTWTPQKDADLAALLDLRDRATAQVAELHPHLLRALQELLPRAAPDFWPDWPGHSALATQILGRMQSHPDATE